MRSLIVGTAGHIDHGKSALVLALTGTDPDRLQEEKERGITIDLGFAHLAAGPDLTLSFVDVPGHERFVRNMLAGAHGIDAVLLVVAADESVMPQTREHFHICRLLDVPRGVVALTKCDLADEEMQALAELETRELVKGSFLEGAPIVRVSARTGQGLADLKAALAGLAAAVPERSSGGLTRLPVDRIFTLKGFGTVVTGTLVSGSIRVGEEVEILPSGRRARVRGLQIHGAAVEQATAGHRAAVNLTGLEVAELARGDVLARPGTLQPTTLADVEVSLLEGERPLTRRRRLRVHAGSAEVLARVVPLGGEPITPGRAAFAQLRFEAPVVLGRGDRLILRSYSPVATIGGAQVLDPLARSWRRREGDVPARLTRLRDAGAREAASVFVEDAHARGIHLGDLAARVSVPAAVLGEALREAPGIVALGRGGEVFASSEALESLSALALAAVTRSHEDDPLRAAMPLEELRRRVFARSRDEIAERVLGDLAAAGRLRVSGDGAALAGHRPTFMAADEKARETLLSASRAAGLAGLEVGAIAGLVGGDRRLAERVAHALLAAGELQRLGTLALLHRDAVMALIEDVRRRFPPGAVLDVGAFKELTGLTRKHAIPLLELLDARGVTRRAGNERIVLG